MLDIEAMMGVMKGVVMEMTDCALPHLKGHYCMIVVVNVIFIPPGFPGNTNSSAERKFVYILQYRSVKNKRKSGQITNLILLAVKKPDSPEQDSTHDPAAMKPTSYH